MKIENKKIVLNYLPPADINTPSAAYSILKSFMKLNGYETEIKYWNFLFSPVSSIYDNEHFREIKVQLIPALALLCSEREDPETAKKLASFLHGLQPVFQTQEAGFYQNSLAEIRVQVNEIIAAELAKTDFENMLLFGFTSKFHQWLLASVIAREVKKRHPGCRIVIGGFTTGDAAIAVMNICEYFDFAVWGEGEYPLLELSSLLRQNRNNFDSVPRLAWRKNGEIIKSTVTHSAYLNFDNYIFPDYDDYMAAYPIAENKCQIAFPLNSIRACKWNRCKFCDFNHGYKYRERSPESIRDELEFMAAKYGITNFHFVDNDIFGTKERFEKMLDLVIASHYTTGNNYSFWGEMIPNEALNAVMVKKMAIAGFKNVFAGYDALTDTLLRKMDKSNTFSDNILFVKHAIRYGLKPVVNVISGTPGETVDDVNESMHNMHFLRFFMSSHRQKIFTHSVVTFVLSEMAGYYRSMDENEVSGYDFEPIVYLLPANFIAPEHRFKLFRWRKKSIDNIAEWENMQRVEWYYLNNKFTYRLLNNGEVCFYEEYLNDTLTASFAFDDPVYIEVLRETDGKICTYEYLYQNLSIKFPALTHEKLKTIITAFRDAYLVYCNKELSDIVAVIHAE